VVLVRKARHVSGVFWSPLNSQRYTNQELGSLGSTGLLLGGGGDLVKAFPNRTTGQVYGEPHAVSVSSRRFDFCPDSGLSEMPTGVRTYLVPQKGMRTMWGCCPADYGIVPAGGKPAKPGEAGEPWVPGTSRAARHLDNKQARVSNLAIPSRRLNSHGRLPFSAYRIFLDEGVLVSLLFPLQRCGWHGG
jgi:hypothetical protein